MSKLVFKLASSDIVVATMQEKITPQELIQRVDADYYGYRDEDDGILLNYEISLEGQCKCQGVNQD